MSYDHEALKAIVEILAKHLSETLLPHIKLDHPPAANDNSRHPPPAAEDAMKGHGNE